MRLLRKIVCLASFLVFTALESKDPSWLFSFKKTMGDALCYFITSSDVSDETAAYTHDLMKKIDPAQTITRIQKFNAFGEYLFGRHNTIALPFLNYLIFNTKSLKKLSEEAQRFVIGRTLYTMSHPKNHMVYKLALPLMYNLLLHMQGSPTSRQAIADLPRLLVQSLQGNSSQGQVTQAFVTAAPSLLSRLIAELHIAYASRHIEWQADIETAKMLNCAKGGIEFFKSYNEFSSDNTVIGRISSKIPLFEWLYGGLFLVATSFFPRLNSFKPEVTVAGLTFVQFPLADGVVMAKNSMPGQITPHSNFLTHVFWKLPIASLFSHSATTRIANLEKLRLLVPATHKKPLEK